MTGTARRSGAGKAAVLCTICQRGGVGLSRRLNFPPSRRLPFTSPDLAPRRSRARHGAADKLPVSSKPLPAINDVLVFIFKLLHSYMLEFP